MRDNKLMQDAPAEVAVVTGADRGLGRALAVALAHRGVAVAGLARDPFQADEESILTVAADVSDPKSADRAFAEIRARLGAPTILINNAGAWLQRDILEETPKSFMDTVQTKLGGAFNCCHAVLPDMVASGRGRIINIITSADIQPAPMAAGSSVANGATRILTRSLVADLGDRFPGIVINDWIPDTLESGTGLARGIEPSVAAQWGATLALLRDAAINGLIFEQEHELQSPRSLKQRFKDRLLGNGRSSVQLS